MLNAIKRWWNKPEREIQELCQLAEAFARADEREQCALIAESATAYTQFQTVEHYKIASAIADGIRMRSNYK